MSAPGKFWIPVISRVIGTAFRLPRMTANRNSFQVPIRIRIAAAAIPGRAAGIVTRKSVPSREQPSIRAAFSSETGTSMKKLRNNQMISGSQKATLTITSEATVSVRPTI
ncbi:hypothetical protein D3C83_30690 [compost metagenome]